MSEQFEVGEERTMDFVRGETGYIPADRSDEGYFCADGVETVYPGLGERTRLRAKLTYGRKPEGGVWCRVLVHGSAEEGYFSYDVQPSDDKDRFMAVDPCRLFTGPRGDEADIESWPPLWDVAHGGVMWLRLEARA